MKLSPGSRVTQSNYPRMVLLVSSHSGSIQHSGRRQQQQRGQRQKQQPPKFFLCSIKLINIGTILLVCSYLIFFSSLTTTTFPYSSSSKTEPTITTTKTTTSLTSDEKEVQHTNKVPPSSINNRLSSTTTTTTTTTSGKVGNTPLPSKELPQWSKGSFVNKQTSSSFVGSLSSHKGIDIPNTERNGENNDDHNHKHHDNNNNGEEGKRDKTNKKKKTVTTTIGVASTVTGCGTDPFVDGAAVLQYSLNRHSTERYNYKMYILYHPSAYECVAPLSTLGFTLLERPTPIDVQDIRGDGGLKERITQTGCCGEKELIKLEAYTLVDHPIIVHMDLDVLVLKPMDDVIDFMLDPTSYQPGGPNESKLTTLPLMWPQQDIPNEITLLFTKDYNVVAPRRVDKPYQGGFFMIKPNMDTYEEFRQIILEGNYDVKSGWGKKVGPFHGGMTIQGLLPWYHEYLHRGTSVELNRCVYNNMSDRPVLERPNGMQICRTNEDHCEDCRYRPIDEIVTFHYTICQKPWKCLRNQSDRPDFALCRNMNQEWYNYRSQLETSWGRSGHGLGTYQTDRYFGYCTHMGGYVPIEQPFGPDPTVLSGQ